MSREIKFRAWDGRAMQYGGFSVHASEGKIQPVEGLSTVTESSPLMQYTGLTDKNGVEIYEGDGVKFNGYEVSNGKQTRPERTIIIGGRGGFFTDTFHVANIKEQQPIEVIGDIYTNPELLKPNNPIDMEGEI